jgi:hypothetical protein
MFQGLSIDQAKKCLNLTVQCRPTMHISFRDIGSIMTGIEWNTFNQWIEHNDQIPTGCKDSQGELIFAGDILERYYNEFYPIARGQVLWKPEYAAYVLQGSFADGGGWHTFNLKDSRSYRKVGDKTTPGALYPAMKVASGGLFPEMPSSLQ